VPHESGKRNLQALQGIGFERGNNLPDGNCDNERESSTPIAPSSTPIPHQAPHQQTTENQGFHTTHTNFPTPVEKIFNQPTDRFNVDPKNSDECSQLGWVVCDAEKSSLPGVGNWGGTGVETLETGVEERREDVGCETLDSVATESVAEKDKDAEAAFLAERFRFYTQRSEFKALVKPFVTANRCEVIEAAIALLTAGYLQKVCSDWEWYKSLPGFPQSPSELAQAEVAAAEELAQVMKAEEACPPAETDEQEWAVGDRIIVDTDVPSLKEFNGQQGTVEVVKDASAQCLVNFAADEYIHIPFRGLRRIK
jgi:hypothetical protein